MKAYNLMLLSIVTIFIAYFAPADVYAGNGGTDEVRIQTNAICDACKKRIEDALYMMPGVKSAVLNLDDKVVTVVYKPSKVNPEKLRQTIADVGYNADEVMADTAAREKLPHCCVHGH